MPVSLPKTRLVDQLSMSHDINMLACNQVLYNIQALVCEYHWASISCFFYGLRWGYFSLIHISVSSPTTFLPVLPEGGRGLLNVFCPFEVLYTVMSTCPPFILWSPHKRLAHRIFYLLNPIPSPNNRRIRKDILPGCFSRSFPFFTQLTRKHVWVVGGSCWKWIYSLFFSRILLPV